MKESRLERPSRTTRGAVGIWSAVAILSILLSFTAYIISTRMSNMLPGEQNVISITRNEPSMDVSGSDGESWQVGQEIDLFESAYKNGKGEIVVESSSGNTVIAPGTTNYYRFYVKNDGNVALDFSLRILPSFVIDGVLDDEMIIPIEIRLVDQDGRYLLGGYDKWVSVSKLQDTADEKNSYVETKNTVGTHSYYAYVLEWRWAFESGNDELDTLLGSSAVETELEFSLEISTSTVESDDPYAKGGKRDGDVSGIDWDLKQLAMAAFVVLGVIGLAAGVLAFFYLYYYDDVRSSISRRKY